MNKPRTILLVSALSFCLLSLAPLNVPNFRIVWYAYGIDVHNNDIAFLEVYQLDGGSYVLLANLTSTGQNVTIEASKEIRFNCSVLFNSSLCISGAQAEAKTRVNASITYDSGASVIWDNATLNTTGTTSLSGGFYRVMKQGDWNTTLAIEGEVYNCTFLYYGFYVP